MVSANQPKRQRPRLYYTGPALLVILLLTFVSLGEEYRNLIRPSLLLSSESSIAQIVQKALLFNGTNSSTDFSDASTADGVSDKSLLPVHGEKLTESIQSDDGRQSKPLTSPLEFLQASFREATRLLYKDSPQLQRWLEEPLPAIYIYSSLPEEWSNLTRISDCLEQRFLPDKYPNCGWFPRICADVQNPRNNRRIKMFMNYRSNYNTDIAYIEWFRNYPVQTADPNKADLFIVPYPHWSHCICHKNLSVYTSKCSYGVDAIERNVMQHLTFYQRFPQRHVFFLGVDWTMVLGTVRALFAKSITVSLGPSDCSLDQHCGHFVTPYLDTMSDYQPAALPKDIHWWTTRNRTFSIGAAMSVGRQFPLRTEFVTNASHYFPAMSFVGKQIRILSLGDFRRQVQHGMLKSIYNESLFCVILPGDNCPQKRFFDVMLNGCLPVVPRFNQSSDEGWPSYFRGHGACSIRRTYPWSKASFFNLDEAGIDYESLVVPFDGNCGIPCLRLALERLTSDDIHQKQANLFRVARLFSFGLDENRFQSEDAFSAMLVAMRHHVHHLKGNEKMPRDRKEPVLSSMADNSDNMESLAPQTEMMANPIQKQVREMTKLFYRDSPDLGKWLASPLPKIYVYDSLPTDWSDVRNISRCIESRWLKEHNGNWTNCLWEPRVCQDVEMATPGSKPSKFMNYRENYNNDVAYIQWFQGYEPKAANPSEADLFIVPYPHRSHCICRRDFYSSDTRCVYGMPEIEAKVLNHLAYYKEKKDRHLFLYGVDWSLVKAVIRKSLAESMSISLGPLDACTGRQLCHDFVTPYVNTAPAYQPDVVGSLPESWWTRRERKYSVGAVFGSPGNFKLRAQLIQNQTIHLSATIGGRPVHIVDLGKQRMQIIQSRFVSIYNESVFCPVLPGDGCPQKRFFDVILSGCIPVVPEFRPSDEDGYPTFFNWMNRCSIRKSYPFSRGTFWGDDTVGIDYGSLVVPFDGQCGMSCLQPALEAVLANATELLRLRRTLFQYAQVFTFGLEQHMYQHADGFVAMMVALRHYLQSLS